MCYCTVCLCYWTVTTRSLGDKYRPDHAQKNDKYSSCVIRITKNGGVPSGNLPAHVKPKECWAHGLRNGYTSFWDLYPKGKERYFIAEVGGNKHYQSQEDVHIGTRGANFGWPYCEGSCNNPKFPSCSCSVHDDPIYTMFHNNHRACIIGGGIYRGSSFNAKYYGVYFYGDFVRNSISYLTFKSDGSKEVSASHTFHETRDAVQDISFDYQGNIWYVHAHTHACPCTRTHTHTHGWVDGKTHSAQTHARTHVYTSPPVHARIFAALIIDSIYSRW